MLQKKEEAGIVLGLWNYSQGSGCLKIMKRLLQVTDLGKNGYYSKVSSIATGIWHIRIVVGFLIHLSSFCMWFSKKLENKLEHHLSVI